MVTEQNLEDTNISNRETGFTSTPTTTSATVGKKSTPPLLLIYTPEGSEEWIRKVEAEFTPTIGKAFKTLEEGIQFYQIYALACGFDPRRHTIKRFRDKTIRTKVLVCNREGFTQRNSKTKPKTLKVQKKSETLQPTGDLTKTMKKLRRFGCRAFVKFKYEGRMYVIEQFHEGHNHQLLSPRNREFQKLTRNLSLFHKQTIIHHSKVNIGPSASYRICKEIADGYENIGASLVDFKNFQRDVKCFIGLKDAEMFISNFEKLLETRNGFYFSYELDDGRNLCRVFWADAESKRAYHAFGDGVSYDPTYNTNKYHMVFTPFTGVDNHKKSVTFGCALLSNEDEESFKWTFNKFLEAMGKKEPQFIITDQDPAIKNAVPAVFKTARHRFCMWHIMSKVPEKVGQAVSRETEFLNILNEIVWDTDMEPQEFEERWCQVVADHDLEENNWLSQMFNIREKWIPAYFRDLPMGNILRTTQRSESENSFFKKFQNQFGTLVEFWMRYETAIDQQRHTFKRLEMESENAVQQPITLSPLERHAINLYTHEVFHDVQEEIKASMCSCGMVGYTKTSEYELTDIEDSTRKKTFEVMHIVGDNQFACTCKLFERKGILCRHVVWVLSNKHLKAIPDKYIKVRWTKNAVKKPIYDLDGNLLNDFDVTDFKKVEMSKVWSEIYATIGVVGKKEIDDMKNLASILKQFRESLDHKTKQMTKEKELEQLIGCTAPAMINILPPVQSNNKGSGKRLLSSRNQAIDKAKKPKRRCNNCKQMTRGHDKRNCPNPYAEKPPDDEEDSDYTQLDT